MIYLSIDNALSISGWAIWKDEKLIKWGTFKTKSIDSLGKRLFDIKYEILNLLAENHVDKVFFEDCQSQNSRNPQTYHKLAMVKGLIFLICFEEGVECECLYPSAWRSILNKEFKFKFGRSRVEQKKRAREFVKEHFEVEPSEDECDAICLGYAGMLELKKKNSDW